MSDIIKDTKSRMQKSIDSLSEPTKSLSPGTINHEFWDYNKEEIQDLFQEYDNPNFICLFTKIGAIKYSRVDFLHCLLIAFTKPNLCLNY